MCISLSLSKENHAIEAWLKKALPMHKKREGKARRKEKDQSRKRSRTKEKKVKRRKDLFTGSK